MSPRLLRRLLASAAAVALGGCATAASAGVHPEGTGTRQLGRRLVAAKEAPSTLVADDASRCSVSHDRFARTSVGDRVWCAWLVTR